MIKSQVNIKDKGSFNVATKSWDNVRITPVYPLSTNDGIQQNITVNPPNINDIIADNTGFIWKINNITKSGTDFTVSITEQTSETPTDTLLPDITFEKAAMCTPNSKGLLVPHFHDSFVSTNAFRNALSYNMKRFVKVNVDPNYYLNMTEQPCLDDKGYWYHGKCNKIPNPMTLNYSFEIGQYSKLYVGIDTVYVTDKYDYTWKITEDVNGNLSYEQLKHPETQYPLQGKFYSYSYNTNDQGVVRISNTTISFTDIYTGFGYSFGENNYSGKMGIGEIDSDGNNINQSADPTKFYEIKGNHRFKKIYQYGYESYPGAGNGGSYGIDFDNNLWVSGKWIDLNNVLHSNFEYTLFDNTNKYIDIVGEDNQIFIKEDGTLVCGDIGFSYDDISYNTNYYQNSNIRINIPSDIKFKSFSEGVPINREYFLDENDYLYRRGFDFLPDDLFTNIPYYTFFPKKVSDIKFKKVITAQNTHAALDFNGNVYMWGYVGHKYGNDIDYFFGHGWNTKVVDITQINITGVQDIIFDNYPGNNYNYDKENNFWSKALFYIKNNNVYKINTTDIQVELKCDRFNHNLCTIQSECENANGFWYNNICNSIPLCNSSNLINCNNELDCINANGFWYNNICNSQCNMKLSDNSKIFKGIHNYFITDINNHTWTSELYEDNRIFLLYNLPNSDNYQKIRNKENNTYPIFKHISSSSDFWAYGSFYFIDDNDYGYFSDSYGEYYGYRIKRLSKLSNTIKYKKFSSYDKFYLALDINGKLYALNNYYIYLDDPTKDGTNRTTYEYIPLDSSNTYIDVISGRYKNIGIRTNGEMILFGFDVNSPTWNQRTYETYYSDISNNKTWKKLFENYENYNNPYDRYLVYAQDSNNDLYQFLTNSQNHNISNFMKISSINFKKIMCGLSVDDFSYNIGYEFENGYNVTYGLSESGTLYYWKNNILDTTIPTISIYKYTLPVIVDFIIQRFAVHAIDIDGNIWAWGCGGNISYGNGGPYELKYLAPGLERSETPTKIYNNFTN